MEPSPETLALLDSITSDPAKEAVHAGYTNLPNPLTSFVGRESELAAVSRLFLAGCLPQNGARLVTLTGAGGSGKTRLAIQLARSLLPSYRHGAWWVDLSSLADASLVPDTVLAALGVAPPPGLPPTQALLGYLRSRTLLLALDNCEHLAEACAHLVAAILQASPGVQVLATSREPLGVPGEQLWPVPTFAVPAVGDNRHHTDAETLLSYDAVRLFVERARMHRPAFSLGEQNADQVAEICRRLDGIPLAIELAAARVRTMEVSDVLVRLQNRLRLLAAGSTLAPPRQQTLRASIDWSYNLLSPAECRLLQRLAVFVGGCTLAAAEAVCADDALPVDEIVDLLGHLVDRSLVIAEGGRYRFLETIREYALERLNDTGEAVTLRERHAGYFAGYLEDRYERILGGEQYHVIMDIEVEIGNVRAAWDWALTGRRGDLLRRSADSLHWYYEMHNRFNEGEALFGRTVQTLKDDPSCDRTLLAGLCARHGYYLGRLGRLADARQQLEWASAHLRQVDERSELALALTFLGTIVWQEGDFPQARALLEESLGLNRIIGDRHWMSLSLFFLALVEHSSGNEAQADQYFDETLALGHATGQPRMISMTSVFSAPTLLALGRYAEARERLQAGLELARTSHDWWLVSTTLANLGILLHTQGDHAGAKTALLEAVSLTQESGNRWDQAWVEVSLGDVYLALHDAAQAENHYRSALQLAFEGAAIPIALDALAGFATLHAQAGDREWALEIAGQVAAHPASTGNARARVTEVVRLLDPDSATPLPAAATGTFEDMVHRILAATTS